MHLLIRAGTVVVSALIFHHQKEAKYRSLFVDPFCYGNSK